MWCGLSFLGVLLGTVYVLLMGQNEFHANGCVGRLRRRLLAVPSIAKKVLERAGGQRAVRAFEAAEYWCCGSLNPVLPVFYLTLVIGGYQWLVVSSFCYLSAGEQQITHLLFAVTLASFVWASLSDPGSPVHGASNRRAESQAGHEQVLGPSLAARSGRKLVYFSDDVCAICRLVKPPRTKHCYTCHRCVTRFDHHCPWINNDVGESNSAIFSSFLAATAGICMWVSYVTGGVLLDLLRSNPSTRMFPWDLWVQFLMFVAPGAALLWGFSSVIAIIMLIFLVYNLSLVARNLTTHESFRYSLLNRLLADLRHLPPGVSFEPDPREDPAIRKLRDQLRLWLSHHGAQLLRDGHRLPNFFDEGSVFLNFRSAWFSKVNHCSSPWKLS